MCGPERRSYIPQLGAKDLLDRERCFLGTGSTPVISLYNLRIDQELRGKNVDGCGVRRADLCSTAKSQTLPAQQVG